MTDSDALTQTLAHLAEQAGLNAAASPHQAQVEGWLLRLSPGKAKRSRCVNALAAGALPLDELLARCRHSFAQSGLPLILRLTPFSQPADLDEQLARRGWRDFDPALVMVLAQLPAAPDLGEDHLIALSPAAYAQLVGELRGSSAAEIAGQAQRLQAAPIPHQAFILQRNNTLLACGQVAVDGLMAGLFDIYTPEAQRGQGHALRLCQALLAHAATQKARHGYLQVGVDNHAAQRVYGRLGFIQAYRYHYRSDDPLAWD